ncbi:MAG: bifunctional riboflavin kinase/FAD synthetase [Burkholderiales bacterium]
MQVYRHARGKFDTPIALTIGNFDGVHLGHQAMLDRLCAVARELAVPAAVMTFEPHPRELFTPDEAPARLTSLREKLDCLKQRSIDRVYVQRFNLAFASIVPDAFVVDLLVKNLGIGWLLVGDDFRFGARRGGDYALLAQMAKRYEFQLEAMHSIEVAGERVSSTAVRAALAEGDFPRAEKLLGRPYSMSGRVMHGEKLGRKLGFPTANIALKRRRAPLTGIFAVKLHGIGVVALPAVASLGVRPTVMANGTPMLEVHVLDFNADIYGRHVTVEFLHKLRDEEKYEDLNRLRQQIQRDVDQARHYLNSHV